MNDQLILDQLKKGSEKAFEQIFTKFYSPLCEYASHYISDVDSEELVQDLMLYIWENKTRIEIKDSLQSYLFKSVKNRCLNTIRNNQHKQRIHSLLYQKLKDEFEDPNYYLVKELSENIQQAIDELPESYRGVFKMSRFSDLTNKQVADQLGVSIKTVEYRITKSLNILRVKFIDYLSVLLVLFL